MRGSFEHLADSSPCPVDETRQGIILAGIASDRPAVLTRQGDGGCRPEIKALLASGMGSSPARARGINHLCSPLLDCRAGDMLKAVFRCRRVTFF